MNGRNSEQCSGSFSFLFSMLVSNRILLHTDLRVT